MNIRITVGAVALALAAVMTGAASAAAAPRPSAGQPGAFDEDDDGAITTSIEFENVAKITVTVPETETNNIIGLSGLGLNTEVIVFN